MKNPVHIKGCRNLSVPGKFLFFLFAFMVFLSAGSGAQSLKPGFDKEECLEMLRISSRFGDSAYFKNIQAPAYDPVYRSPVSGLDNCWDLWISKKGVAVISVRGTTASNLSWLANLYAAMVPAQGVLHLSEKDSFVYDLAQHPAAGVHIGWLVSTAFLSETILTKIDSCYRSGIRDIIITGHSQGGAIAYLLTAWLYRKQQHGLVPADIRFKTYCTAAPKPGNLYFAYEYESMTQQGWSYNIVNPADWVPEVPIAVQTVNDMNRINPFVSAGSMFGKQKFPRRIALRHMYNRLSKPSIKAQRNNRKYLGDLASGMVRKTLKDYHPPKYLKSSHYVRTGAFIVLPADDAYYRLFPDDRENVFCHHLHRPYLYLTERLP